MKPPKHTGVRTFEAVQYVSGYVEATKLDDYPAQMQDEIMLELERLSKAVELPLALVHLRCEVNPDVPDGHPRRFFVHMIASEVVVGDNRDIKTMLQRFLETSKPEFLN